MARQLIELLHPISDMSDEELAQHIFKIREQKFVERPAAKKHKEKAERPAKQKRAKGIQHLLANMGEEEMAKLLEDLQNGRV